ncbi:unnamed protein product [Ceratitis capitata]|uniref:(Mediterranean fruit fly) hypothetical protein n=1 Tax=Ceratitis capitata TaxID=7213 RepID=A0A811UVF4_CERCA|nr:unnamed protein product [Ceratitis capitata]
MSPVVLTCRAPGAKGSLTTNLRRTTPHSICRQQYVSKYSLIVHSHTGNKKRRMPRPTSTVPLALVTH